MIEASSPPKLIAVLFAPFIVPQNGYTIDLGATIMVDKPNDKLVAIVTVLSIKKSNTKISIFYDKYKEKGYLCRIGLARQLACLPARPVGPMGQVGQMTGKFTKY